MDYLSNAFPSECFLPEPSLDVVQNLLMSGIVLIQNVLELQVSRSKTITEMLSKDPTAVCIY